MTYSGRPASIQVYMPLDLIMAIDRQLSGTLSSRSKWIRQAIILALAEKENGP